MDIRILGLLDTYTSSTRRVFHLHVANDQMRCSTVYPDPVGLNVRGVDDEAVERDIAAINPYSITAFASSFRLKNDSFARDSLYSRSCAGSASANLIGVDKFCIGSSLDHELITGRQAAKSRGNRELRR